MYNGCSWLPELLKLSGSVNDEEVENELYEIYLHELKNNEALVTSIIPLGDGIALSVKKDK